MKETFIHNKASYKIKNKSIKGFTCRFFYQKKMVLN